MFTGREKTPISIAEFKNGTVKFKQRSSGGVRAFFYSKEAIEELLAQNGAVGVRVYFADAGNGDKEMYIVAVNSSGKDLRPNMDSERSTAAHRAQSHIILKSDKPCPTFCD